MGVVAWLVDSILFFFFLITFGATVTMDTQLLLPPSIFPATWVEMKNIYVRESGDYLMANPPHFFTGLLWLQLLFICPLCLVNLYGIVARKAWFNTTCLICGISFFTSKVASVSELIGSGKAPDKVVSRYFTFMCLSALAVLRGLLLKHGKPTSRGTTSLNGKKRV